LDRSSGGGHRLGSPELVLGPLPAEFQLEPKARLQMSVLEPLDLEIDGGDGVWEDS